MPYPQDVLHANEELVLDLHPHWWYMASSIAGLAAAVVLGAVALVNDWPDWVRLIAAALVLGTLVWFVERYIRWVSTHFVLTSDRVIYRSGIIAKRGIEIPLERINTIFFHQRIIERMFGLGDLEIESASKDGAQRFEDIRNPSKVQNEIYQQMEQNEDRMFRSRPAGGGGGGDLGEALERLEGLRDRGTLTSEEFEAQKRRLLEG